MSPPARKGIFVGYTPSSQSWMVYFPATRTILSSRSVTFDEEWRPLSPSRPFPELPSDFGGAAPLEREPFLFKHLVNTGSVITIVMHSIVLPPRPVAPTMPSISTAQEIGTVISSPAPAMTRSGHRFRANASPYVPTAALPVILEGSDSSDTEDEDTSVELSPPAAPQKGPAPSNRFLAPTPATSTASLPAALPSLDDVAESILPAAPQPLRRSQRNSQPPHRLTAAYM